MLRQRASKGSILEFDKTSNCIQMSMKEQASKRNNAYAEVNDQKMLNEMLPGATKI